MKDVKQISISNLVPFAGHPYKVEDNEDMEVLTESIRENGILNPLIVRPAENDPCRFEIVSGHRRAHAARLAGIETVPAFVYPLNRDQAAVLVVDSNLHRERLLPSEKAFAYKLKAEALYHQGKRNDLTSVQFAPKLATEQIAEDVGTSKDTIKRYIRLTYLVPELLDLMDEGKIAFSVGVELSFLPKPAQYDLLEAMRMNDCTPSYSQAVRLHRAASAGALNQWTAQELMAEQKPNQRDQIRFRRDELERYFPVSYTDAQIKQDILAGLALLQRQRQRERERDER